MNAPTMIQAKFALGQRVAIIRQRYEAITRPCEVCGGVGTLALAKGGSVPCTARYTWKDRCEAGNVQIDKRHPWAIADHGTIGKIEASVHLVPDEHNEDKNRYMLLETGIGSGSVYYETDLWESDEAAEAECHSRNSPLR